MQSTVASRRHGKRDEIVSKGSKGGVLRPDEKGGERLDGPHLLFSSASQTSLSFRPFLSGFAGDDSFRYEFVIGRNLSKCKSTYGRSHRRIAVKDAEASRRSRRKRLRRVSVGERRFSSLPCLSLPGACEISGMHQHISSRSLVCEFVNSLTIELLNIKR